MIRIGPARRPAAAEVLPWARRSPANCGWTASVGVLEIDEPHVPTRLAWKRSAVYRTITHASEGVPDVTAVEAVMPGQALEDRRLGHARARAAEDEDVRRVVEILEEAEFRGTVMLDRGRDQAGARVPERIDDRVEQEDGRKSPAVRRERDPDKTWSTTYVALRLWQRRSLQELFDASSLRRPCLLVDINESIHR